MIRIKKKEPASIKDIDVFLSNIDFKVPEEFIEFFKRSNGYIVSSEDTYISIWSLNDMIELNEGYKVDEYAPGFFIFASDGGDMAYCIEKETSFIYSMPFIGMAYDKVFLCESFIEFLKDFSLA